MTTFEHALELILHAVRPLEVEEVETHELFERVTAEDVVAPHDLPLFQNSAMDGYAVRTEDCMQGTALQFGGFIPAGAEIWPQLEEGNAIRIMTGAPIPDYADAVIPLEETAEDPNGGIRNLLPVRKGQHIRCAGEDVQLGDTIIHSGTPIGVAEVSLLAAMGITSLRVHRKPVVSIVATGDELVPLGAPIAKGKIFDSNSLALAAAVRASGATARILGIAKDNISSLKQKLREAVNADALITVAGVSVGDHDLVRESLANLGAVESFWGVDIKPGKATAFALLEGKPIFSLPGNPVSALITFEELVRPALLRMAGHRAVMRPLVTAVLQESLSKKPGKVFFARVKLKFEKGRFLAWSSGPQETGYQKTLLNADAFAILPADRTIFNVGEELRVQVLPSLQGTDAK